MNFLNDALYMSVDQLLRLRLEVDKALLKETKEHNGWIMVGEHSMKCPICEYQFPYSPLLKNYCPRCGSYIGIKK